MGLNYSIELFFPADRVGDVLRGVVSMAAKSDVQSTVMLPDGSAVTVPFPFTDLLGPKPEPGTASLSSGKRVMLETNLLFPALADVWGFWSRGGDDIYVDITLDRRYVGLRIPGHLDHPFQSMLTTHSDRRCPLIPTR